MLRDKLKLQKQLSKRRKTKEGIKDYNRFVFTIPPDIIRSMGWEDDDSEFEAKAHPTTGKLVIEKK